MVQASPPDRVLQLIEKLPDSLDPAHASQIEALCSSIARSDTRSIDAAMRQFLKPLDTVKLFLPDGRTNDKALKIYCRASRVSRTLSRYLFQTDSPEAEKDSDLWEFTFPQPYPDYKRGDMNWPWQKDKNGHLHFKGPLRNDFVSLEAACYGPEEAFEQAEKHPRR